MRKLRLNSKEYEKELNTFKELNKNINLDWYRCNKNISIIEIDREEQSEIEDYILNNQWHKNSIWDAYDRPSSYKVASYNRLENHYSDWITKITGYCCMSYTYQAIKELDGYMLLAKETKDNSYITIYIIK